MKIPAVVATSLAMILGLTSAGFAHEDAVLKSTRTSVTAGGVVPLQGVEFDAGGHYTLKLVGPLREYTLGKIQADSAGEFSLEVVIAAAVVPGAYKFEAVATDGDVVARLDFTVLPVSQAVIDDVPHDGGMKTMARSDDIQIDRDRSGIEWGLIGLLIGAAVGLGSGLVIAGRSGSNRNA